jgi:hypothetical protein
MVRNANGAIVYSRTAADFTRTDFTRVRYRFAATSTVTQFPGSYVDADFRKDFLQQAGSNGYSRVGFLAVPDLTNAFTLQGDVSDLTVLSDSTAVTNGYGFTGRIEIWPWNYGTAGGNGSLYDHSDTSTGSDSYGSFQLHSSLPRTIFAWNRHSESGEVGLGQAPAGANPDWTFTTNSGTISNFSVESFANHPVTTPALTLHSRTNIEAGVLKLPLPEQPSVQLRSDGSALSLAGVTVSASISEIVF